MTKDKKGVTLVSLVITIIVMMIIFGITLRSATVILDNSNLTKIQTNLYSAKVRAETLLEQYLFDGNIEHLISFSEMFEGEINIFPIGYYCKASDTPEEESDIIDATSDISCKTLRMNPVTKSSQTFTIQLKSDEKFENKVKSIYSNYYDQMSQIKYKANGAPETIKIEGTDEEVNVTENVGRYLFVKWGEKQCISQGIIKKSTDGKVNNNSIVNDDDYIIVAYDLYAGEVDVAYSKGYRANGELVYRYVDMLMLEEVSTEEEAEEEVEENEG